MAEEAVGSLLVVVKLPNEIDIANCAAIEFGLLVAVGAPGLVIADMTSTAFCGSAGMEMLVYVDDRARARGSTLRIVVTPDSSVARMMVILGASSVLSVYKSVDDARPAGRAVAADDGPGPHSGA